MAEKIGQIEFDVRANTDKVAADVSKAGTIAQEAAESVAVQTSAATQTVATGAVVADTAATSANTAAKVARVSATEAEILANQELVATLTETQLSTKALTTSLGALALPAIIVATASKLANLIDDAVNSAQELSAAFDKISAKSAEEGMGAARLEALGAASTEQVKIRERTNALMIEADKQAAEKTGSVWHDIGERIGVNKIPGIMGTLAQTDEQILKASETAKGQIAANSEKAAELARARTEDELRAEVEKAYYKDLADQKRQRLELEAWNAQLDREQEAEQRKIAALDDWIIAQKHAADAVIAHEERARKDMIQRVASEERRLREETARMFSTGGASASGIDSLASSIDALRMQISSTEGARGSIQGYD